MAKMTKLSAFRSDTRAINDGAWETVDAKRYGDLQIRTRGYTDDFIDAQAARIGAAAEAYDGDRSLIPNSTMREINGGLARDFLVLDVRNLANEDNSPVTLAQFLGYLGQQEYLKLQQAVFACAGRVTTRVGDQVVAATGN